MRLHQGQVSFLSRAQTYNINACNNFFCGHSADCGINGVSMPMTNGYIYAHPIFFGRDFDVKEFGVYIKAVTTGGANFGYGIYEENVLDLTNQDRWRYPGKLLVSAVAGPISVPGFYSTTLANPLRLFKNKLYWGGFIKDTTGAITPNAAFLNLVEVLGYLPNTTMGLNMIRGHGRTQAYGTGLPDPFPSGTTDGDVVKYAPLVYVREANQNRT